MALTVLNQAAREVGTAAADIGENLPFVFREAWQIGKRNDQPLSLLRKSPAAQITSTNLHSIAQSVHGTHRRPRSGPWGRWGIRWVRSTASEGGRVM